MEAPTCKWWVDGIPADCGQPAMWRIAGSRQPICADHVESAELAGLNCYPRPGAVAYDAGRGNRPRLVHAPGCPIKGCTCGADQRAADTDGLAVPC